MADEELYVPKACNKSKVWQNFGFAKKDGKLDKTHAICKICRAAIKYTGSTTNLGTHLKRRHGETSASSSDSSMATVAASTSTPAQSISTFFHAPLATNSARSKAITEAIAFFICKDIQPYSVVENEGFQYLLHILEPRYHIPNRKLFTDKEIPLLYEKVRHEIAKSLSNAKRVAITVDGWTSRATDSYVTVTAHYIDEEWVLQKHVLQTRPFVQRGSHRE